MVDAAAEIAAWDAREVGEDYSSPGYTYAYKNRMRRTLAAIRRVAVPGGTVLDVAGASGNYSIELAKLGLRVTWNDLRADFVPHVRRKMGDLDVRFRPGDITNGAVDGPYDVVFAGEVIEHVAHPDQFLAELGRLTKPGGAIVVTTPSGNYVLNRLPKFSECADPSVFEAVQFRPDSDGHIFLLHRDELRPLAEQAGLTIDRIEYFNNPLTSGHLKTRYLLKVMPRAAVRAIDWCTQRLPAGLASRLHGGMLVVLRKPAR